MYLTTALLSWARCWTRPVVCQLLTSLLMVSAPNATAVSNGTAIKAASRHRTGQFPRANRDRAELGGPGCRWVVPTVSAGSGVPGWCWATTTGVWPPEAAGPMTGSGPLLAASRPPTASEPSLAAVPPVRGTEPSRSAGPLLMAPAAPAGSPGLVTDRLLTTFAPRIGKPEPAHMPGPNGASRPPYALSSLRNDRRCSGQKGGRVSRVTKRVKTYNHRGLCESLLEEVQADGSPE